MKMLCTAAVLLGAVLIPALIPAARRPGRYLLRMALRIGAYAGISLCARVLGFDLGLNAVTCAAAAFLGFPGILMILTARLLLY